MSITTFRRVVELDANGVPVGHQKAMQRAAEYFRNRLNELPDTSSYYSPTDMELFMDASLSVYLQEVTRGSK